MLQSISPAVEPQICFADVIRNAKRAGSRLAEKSSFERSQALFALADGIALRADDFARAIVYEGVKTITEARGEVARAELTFRIAAEEIKRFSGERIDFSADPRGAGRHGWVDRKPVGVVLGITPFNDPLNLIAHKVAPAIATGNAVIIKPHPDTPTPAVMLEGLAKQIDTLGNSLQVFLADGATTEAMIKHPDVDLVSFTGGRETAKHVARAAAGKPLMMELGGVAVTIVHKDADVDAAIPALVSGITAAAGQNCLHVQRVLVHDSIRKEVEAHLAQRLNELVIGDRLNDQTEMGRLINRDAFHRCIDWVHDAVSGGGYVICGDYNDDTVTKPILIGDPGPNSNIVTQEIFGPLTTLESYSDIDEAIAMAARSGPALAAAVFTRDIHVPHKLSQLKVGQIMVNDTTDFRIDSMPFGGPSSAGIGREGVRSSMLAMTEPQVFCIKAPV